MADVDYTLTPVPDSERQSSVSVSATAAAWVIAVTTLITGGTLASGLPLGEALAAVGIGLLLIAVISVATSRLGTKYGVSTAMLAHRTFGRWGAAALGIVLALTLGIGWFAWQVAFFASTLREMFPDSAWSTPSITIVWAGVLMTASAYGGYAWLARLSLIAVPSIFILSGYGVYVALEKGVSLDTAPLVAPTDPITLVSGITAVVGSVVFGAIVLPDVARFARKTSVGGAAAGLGYTLAAAAVMVAGALIITSVAVPTLGRTANIPAAMAALGMGAPAFAILLLAQWTTNDSNLYSGALGLAPILRVPKRLLVVLMGLVGIAIASLGIEDDFVPFLIVLGTYMPPVAGVLIADYYLIRRPQADLVLSSGTPVAAVQIPAVIAALSGGYIASGLAPLGGLLGVTAIVGFMASLLLYIVLLLITRAIGLRDGAVGASSIGA